MKIITGRFRKELFILGMTMAIVIGVILIRGGIGRKDPPKNIVLIVFDCLRYDAVEKGDMDYLQSLEQKGISYKCIAGGNRTFDGFNTILTGKYVNQITYNEDKKVDDSEMLLQEIMKQNGWATAFISSCVGDRGFLKLNYLQGCDFFEDYDGYQTDPWYLKGEAYREIVHGKLFEMCSDEYEDTSKFIILHIAEPHGPYGEEEIETEDIYYSACNEGDSSLEKLILELESQGITENNSLFIITSDHGQQLYEYGSFGHGITLSDEETIVPLVVFGCGTETYGRSERTVSHLDIMSVILDTAEIQTDMVYQGMNFLADMDSAGKKRRSFYTMDVHASDMTYSVKYIEETY